VEIHSKNSCRWGLVSLGEVMLRLDPGDRRIATTRAFQLWEWGGEYNVARGLRRCFGQRTAVVTALAALKQRLDTQITEKASQFVEIVRLDRAGIPVTPTSTRNDHI
jgi:hypothetical protein